MTAPHVPQITLYRRWLDEQRGLSFSNYEDMRRWSVTDIDGFWRSIWDYFDLQSPTPFETVLTHGFVVDEKGEKQSKSLGYEAVSPGVGRLSTPSLWSR